MKKYFLHWKWLIFICWCLLYIVLFIIFSKLQNTSDDCPKDILTFEDDDGKLATQLWSYVSIWALAKVNPRWQPYASKATLDRFKTIFTSSSIKLNEYDTLSLECQQRVYAKGGDRVLNFQYVPEIYGDVLFDLRSVFGTEFIFRKECIAYTEEIIQNGKRQMEKQDTIIYTFVAVLLSERMRYNIDVFHYYISSMDWFRKNLENPLFITLGLSYDYEDYVGIFHAKDVLAATTQDYGNILSLIAYCNHLIIDGGNIALFSALFAQGYVHVYDPGMLRNHSNLANWNVHS